MSEKSVLDLLLGENVPDVRRQLPTSKMMVKRLSEIAGEDVVFEIRGLPFNEVAILQEGKGIEMKAQILVAGVVNPKLSDPGLMSKLDALTPVDVVKALLLPGEIEDLSAAIERLSGYRGLTITEIKNDCGPERTVG